MQKSQFGSGLGYKLRLRKQSKQFLLIRVRGLGFRVQGVGYDIAPAMGKVPHENSHVQGCLKADSLYSLSEPCNKQINRMSLSSVLAKMQSLLMKTE